MICLTRAVQTIIQESESERNERDGAQCQGKRKKGASARKSQQRAGKQVIAVIRVPKKIFGNLGDPSRQDDGVDTRGQVSI